MSALLLALPGAAVIVLLEWLVARWLVNPARQRIEQAPAVAPLRRPVRAKAEVPRTPATPAAALPARKPLELDRAA